MNIAPQRILNANNIVVIGAGRMGLACRAFSMRLNHLGLGGFTLGDSNLPHIGEGDLLIVASSSGETQTMYDLTVVASREGAIILAITTNYESRIARLADDVILMPVFKSKHPMKTEYEIKLMGYFDRLVLKLMKELGETSESMWERHTNLE